MITLVCSLYQSCPDVEKILNARFRGADYVKLLLAEYKEKIQKEFSGLGMKAPSLAKAKRVISDFKKVSPDPENELELKLCYAESVAEYGSSFGDMTESFYNSLDSVFRDVVSGLNKLKSEAAFRAFYPRLQNIITEADVLGYGLSDELCIVLDDELEWNPEEEDTP